MVRNGTGGRRHLIPNDTDSMALRAALRSEMRRRRRGLPGVRRRLAVQAILRHLGRLPAYIRARRVGLYWPADGEPDVRGIAVHARARGKRLYLPVVRRAGRMGFAAWPSNARLRRNRFGIPEPVGRTIAAARIDLLVIPLVAFDLQGNRLGMGGGYYDRALAGRRRPVLAGVAFACQQATSIPAKPWDVPLDYVITERGRRARGKQR